MSHFITFRKEYCFCEEFNWFWSGSKVRLKYYFYSQCVCVCLCMCMCVHMCRSEIAHQIGCVVRVYMNSKVEWQMHWCCHQAQHKSLRRLPRRMTFELRFGSLLIYVFSSWGNLLILGHVTLREVIPGTKVWEGWNRRLFQVNKFVSNSLTYSDLDGVFRITGFMGLFWDRSLPKLRFSLLHRQKKQLCSWCFQSLPN